VIGPTPLVGARIRRIDAPAADLLAISLSTPSLRSVLLFCFGAARSGVGLVTTRPHGLAASSFVQKLRKELEGGRIVAFEQPSETALGIAIERADETSRLSCDFAAARVHLTRDERLLISFSAGTPRSASSARVHWPDSIESLLTAGPELYADQASESLEQQRSRFDRALRSAQKRLQRRLSALDEDGARAEQAAPLRTRATLLLGQQHKVKRGQSSVQLLDYTRDPPEQLEIALDPTRSLKEQIESWFKQARRYERGAELASQRQNTTHAELERLEQLRTRVTTASAEELIELAGQARTLGVRGALQTLAEQPRGGAAQAARATRKPYREFQAFKARTVLVGKQQADNDTLTREHARPHDLWLHARDVSGAHVVVPLARNEVCPEELLLDAAHLAAHFSSARGEPSVDVSYVAKRYVRKPRGAAPGLVQLEREKVLTLRLEAARLTRLLASERSE